MARRKNPPTSTAQQLYVAPQAERMARWRTQHAAWAARKSAATTAGTAFTEREPAKPQTRRSKPGREFPASAPLRERNEQ